MVTKKEDFITDEVMKMHWLDYCKKYNTDTLYFKDDVGGLLTIAEGSGDNLDIEDEEEGYVDYYYITKYENTGREIGGGLLYVKELIADKNLTIKEIIDFIHDNEEFLDEVMLEGEVLISPNEGEDISYELDKLYQVYINSLRLSYSSSNNA